MTSPAASDRATPARPRPRTASLARVAAERVGRAAEWVAIVLLLLRGYRILARRWRCPQGEIDIIAVRGPRLAFVEVKYRRVENAALDAISRRQAHRLHAAAAAFVSRFGRYRSHICGFDAVFVVAWQMPYYARDHLSPRVTRR